MIALFFALSAAVGQTPSEHALHLQQFGHLVPTADPIRTPRGGATPGPHMTVYGYQAYWNADLNAVPWDDLTHLALFNAAAEPDGSLTSTGPWDDAASAVAMGAPYGVRVHLCVTNFTGSELSTLLSSSTARGALVANLKTWVDNTGVHGVNIDFEGLPASERQNMVTFVGELEAAGVGDIVLATPAVDWSDAWDYGALTDKADLFIMGYGYHWSGGNPGPIDPLYGGGIWAAWSLDWSITDYVQTNGGDPSRIIMGLPLYGREWPVTDASAVPADRTGDGDAVIWSSAQAQAATHGRLWDTSTLTPYWMRTGYQGWYQDVESLRSRVQYADNAGIQGIGFWALHYDGGDEAMWTMLREETTDPDLPEDTGDSGGSDSADPGWSETYLADAGLPFLAYPGDTIVLDGSRSTGPGTLQYRWEQLAGPSVTLLQDEGPRPTFRAVEPGTHIFSLRVGDGEEWSGPARSHVVVLDADLAQGGCGCTQLPAPGAWIGIFGMIALRRRS